MHTLTTISKQDCLIRHLHRRETFRTTDAFDVETLILKRVNPTFRLRQQLCQLPIESVV